jgi:hypothetical protein
MAVYDFGLSPDEAWGLSFDEFHVLLKRHQEAEERAFFRTGIICSVIANVNRGKNTKAYKPKDFMPKKPDNRDMIDKVADINRFLGGKDGR